MLVFGIDIPLVEIIITLVIIIFLLLIESIVLIFLITKEMNKSKKLAALLETLSETLLAIKKAEIEELDRFKKK